MARSSDSIGIAGLIRDPGVLRDEPLLEFSGWQGVAAVGGSAVLPWRGHWLAASRAGVSAVARPEDVLQERFGQCAVHLQKARDATWKELSEGWHRLQPDGHLMLVGGNDLGIKSAARRLEGDLGRPGEVVANRARARVVRFVRGTSAGPQPGESGSLDVTAPNDRFALHTFPGAFSAGRLDPGTRLVLEHLDRLTPPGLVFDPGCGPGALGLAALRRWPEAEAILADADRRAVEAVRGNAAELGLAGRCRVAWWDAVVEPPPLERCDLVLANPPFHIGKAVDLAPARAMFRAVGRVLSPGGRALIVGLRTLPFEHDLRRLGRLEETAVDRGYKLLSVTR